MVGKFNHGLKTTTSVDSESLCNEEDGFEGMEAVQVVLATNKAKLEETASEV